MSWSSGKDSAWALHQVHTNPGVSIEGLLTVMNASFNRVSMQGVRRDLVEEQSRLLGYPIVPVEVPDQCSDEQYRQRMAAAIETAKSEGIDAVVFGDLYLIEVRNYREQSMDGTGIEAWFPIWSDRTATREVANEMLGSGVRSIVTCVDTKQLDASFAGREFDRPFLDDLPSTVDPLGENGEFHTFCFEGPMFPEAIPVQVGELTSRGRFVYADLIRRSR